MHFGGEIWLPCLGLSSFFLIRGVQPRFVTFAPFLSRVDVEAALDKFVRFQISAVTNECAEAMAVRINCRADAAFIGPAAFCPHLLCSVSRQIADFIFGQLVLLGNRLALALRAMRFIRPSEHQKPHEILREIHWNTGR